MIERKQTEEGWIAVDGNTGELLVKPQPTRAELEEIINLLCFGRLCHLLDSKGWLR